MYPSLEREGLPLIRCEVSLKVPEADELTKPTPVQYQCAAICLSPLTFAAASTACIATAWRLSH
jgi:hypothetical protein